jgi:Domain of unknown function (DUF4279)
VASAVTLRAVADEPQPQGPPPGEYWVVGGEAPDVKKASFRLHGDELDPGAVTRATGLTPDSAHRKGDARESKSGRHTTWSRSLWLIDSSYHLPPSTACLEDHLSWLPDTLEPARDRLREICAEQSLAGDFYCGYFMHQWNSSIGISARTLARIAALDANFGIDIYGPDPDDPERTVLISDED